MRLCVVVFLNQKQVLLLGVVFDSGDGVSHSVPVFEGYSFPHAVQRFPLAGADVTAQLKKVFTQHVTRFHVEQAMV